MSDCFGDPNMVRKPRPTDWTADEVTRLRECAKSGMTQREAATALGRGHIAVKNKCTRLGIRWAQDARPWTNDEIALLGKVASTQTVRHVADLLERSRPSVKWKIAELGIKFRKYGEAHPECKLPTAKLEELFELKKQGLTYQEIGDRLGVSAPTVGAIVRFEIRYRDSLPLLLEEPTKP